ncbi:hypothetical protein ACROYT_G034597 [Oculina patagonica]
MNFTELPLELVDEILKHLDAISLAKSRQVCRSWRALHFQPRYKLLWKQACFRDIDEDVLTELTGNVYIVAAEEDPGGLSGTTKNIQGENNDINWEAIYQKWFRSRHIGRWPSMVTELKGHRGPVWDVKLSGDRVVTCGEDGTIRVWDSWTSHCLAVYSGHLDAVLSISLRQMPGLSPHADIPHDLIVSGSQDCTVKVWDMKTPCPSAKLTCRGHTSCVNCVAVRENTAASASDDCSVRVWNIITGHCYGRVSTLGDWVKYVRIGKCDTLLSVTDNSELVLWSIKNEEPLSSVELTNTTIDTIQPMPPGVQGATLRGQTALILTHCSRLFAWENKSDGSSFVRNFSLFGPHFDCFERGACLALYGALVSIGTRSGAVHVYHLDGSWENQFTKIHCVLHGNGSTVNAVCLDDDGEGPSLVTGGDDGIVRVYRWFPPSI